MNATTNHRPCWIYDRADRLAALAVRSNERAEALRRERCDAWGEIKIVSSLDARIAAHRERFHRLATCARKVRHAEAFRGALLRGAHLLP